MTTTPGSIRSRSGPDSRRPSRRGIQLRWEVRDNIVGIQRVTGTTPIAGFVPPHERVFKHLFSMTVGFDVVLERRKGERY